MDGGDVDGAAFEMPVQVPVRSEARPALVAGVAGGVAGRLRGKTTRATTTPVGVVVAGLAGFVAGAVCWHFVGFWSFMTEAVFYARPEAQGKAVLRPALALVKNQNRQPGAVAVSDATVACSLVAKVAAGDAEPRGCEGHTYKFHPSRNIARADRGDFGPVPVPTLISGEGVGVVAVGGWSARIEGPDDAKPPVVTGAKKAD